MGISDRISAADVMLDLSVRNKRDLLEVMARKAAIPLGRQEGEILDALAAREELGSTALGKGVAVPHAQIPGEVPGRMLLARLRRPMSFAAGLAAALSMGDLGVIALFAPPEVATLPLLMQRLMAAYRMQAAAGVALVLVALTYALFWAFDRGGRLDADA